MISFASSWVTNHHYSTQLSLDLAPSLDLTSLEKLSPSARVACLLISFCRSLLTISSSISPVPWKQKN